MVLEISDSYPVFFLSMVNDNLISKTQVEDAELVGEETGLQTPILSLEEMIKNTLPRLEKLKEEVKTKKEMIDDALNNDSTYKLHLDKAKEANKLKTGTRQQLLKQPSLATLVNDVRDLREEIKGLQSSLSDYLHEYARLSGASEIQDAQGVVREIVYVAKLVKRK